MCTTSQSPDGAPDADRMALMTLNEAMSTSPASAPAITQACSYC